MEILVSCHGASLRLAVTAVLNLRRLAKGCRPVPIPLSGNNNPTLSFLSHFFYFLSHYFILIPLFILQSHY